MKELIMKSLDKIRPMLQRDGGDVELVDVSNDGVVSVKNARGLWKLSRSNDDNKNDYWAKIKGRGSWSYRSHRSVKLKSLIS